MLARGGNRRPAGRPPSTAAAVVRFVLGSCAAVAVVVVGGFFALRSVTVAEAQRVSREQVRLYGQLVAAAGLSDGVLRARPDALGRLDDPVTGQLLSPTLVRVKLWTKDGTVLYSDEPALIEQRFELGDAERELFRTGAADAEVSDLSAPENRFERPERKLLEAHTTIRTPSGTPALFETYERFASITACAARLRRALALSLIGGLLVLLLSQLPLAWSLVRRLRREHDERERLLVNGVEASSLERQRIAADLHDGVVQDLACATCARSSWRSTRRRSSPPG